MNTRKAVLVTIVTIGMFVAAAFAVQTFADISDPDVQNTVGETHDTQSPETEEEGEAAPPSTEEPEGNSGAQDEEPDVEEDPEPAEDAEEADQDDPDTEEEAAEEEDQTSEHPDIRLTNIKPGQEVTSPLVVKGEARGTWFFEGDFPLVLTDGDGRVIAEGYATAKGEWMTEDFVEFEGVLNYTVPEDGERGSLILQKDNPSGLSENDDAIEVEVRFAPSEEAETIIVRVYFTTAQTGTDTCEATDYVEREIPRTLGVGRAAIEQLLDGPTAAEKEAGYTTSINPGTKLQSLRVEDGTAYADFNEELDRDTGGSCLVASIYTQIANTLKQFPTVNDVVISINGEAEEVLQP